MDNDLMARRLRPPSEPPGPTNGQFAQPDAQFGAAPGPYPEPTEAPWGAAPDAPWGAPPDARSEIPWDRPAQEAWPPAPPSPVPPAQPSADTVQSPAVRAQQTASQARRSSWDDLPSPWDAPVPASWGSRAASPAPTAPAVPPVPPAPAQASSFTQAEAPWDRPAPDSWDDLPMVDDRPSEMFAAYDEPPSRVETQMPDSSSFVDTPPAATDPYDAEAPVLEDVAASPVASWPAWTPPEALAEPASPVVTPPLVAGRALGPTPPEDLFMGSGDSSHDDPGEDSPETPRQEAPADAAEESRGDDAALPTNQQPMTLEIHTSGQGATQPVVLRIELAIVGDSVSVRPLDVARSVGQSTAPGAPADARSGQPDESLTPRHPEFEPRNHHAAQPEVEAAREPAPWDVTAAPYVAGDDVASREPAEVPWDLPPLQPAAQVNPWEPRGPIDAPAAPDVWAHPNPAADWQLEPGPHDPLTSLPAATATPPAPAMLPAPMPQPVPASPAPVTASPPATAASATPAAAPLVAEQPDLWFLAAEPQLVDVDEPKQDETGEPSSLLTMGLTVLMAAVVIGLVIAFLWLMTSLPILR